MPDYPTNCFDNLRTGWNPQEIVLTPDAIRQRGLTNVGTYGVNGQVYAQPLVVQRLARPDGIVSDFVIVATEENWIYAFDAYLIDKVLVWSRQLLPSGERVVIPTDVLDGKNPCGNISPSIGITSTPAIDVERRLMYVCAKSTDGKGNFHHRLYAINVHNGNDWKPPVDISASAHFAHRTVSFSPQWQLQRPGLLLMNGIVYIGFGAHCDSHPGTYRGWVLAYDANTLNQVGAFSSTLSSDGQGGIWQSGRGLAGDGVFVYCQTGNGNFGPDSYGTQIDYGDTLLKLSAPVNAEGVVDFFTPCDQDLMKGSDADLGSGGPMLFPDQSAGLPHLAITAGKEGTIYLLNRDAMSGFTPPSSGWSPCDGSGNPTPCMNSSAVLTTLWMALGQQLKCGWTDSNGKQHNPVDRDALFGGPGLYAPAGGLPTIYFSGTDEPIKVFQYNPAQGTLTAAGQAKDVIPNGSIPVVSSNDGTGGVLWVASRGGPNTSRQLFAYDLDPNLALGLADPKAFLATIPAGPYSPEAADPNSPDPPGSSLGPPATVANGFVYVGGLNEVTIIGLGPAPQQTGGGCFIAEAAVGADSSAVSSLRTFRDTFLIEHRLGKRFISLYERFSPSFARAIKKRRSLRVIARGLIVWPALLVAKAFFARSQRKRARKPAAQTKPNRN
jgi:hypothetical protein